MALNKVSSSRPGAPELGGRAAGQDPIAALALALSSPGRVPLQPALRQAEQALAQDPGAETKLAELLVSLPAPALQELQGAAKRDGLSGLSTLTGALLASGAVNSFSGAPSAAAPAAPAAPSASAATAASSGLGWSDGAQVGGAGAFHEPRPTQEVMKQLAGAGLAVDGSRITRDVSATTQAEMSLQELAAAAFGVPASEVSDYHYVLLAQANPQIAQLLLQSGDPSARLPAGTEVSLATTPMGLEMRTNRVKERLSTADEVLKQAMSPNPPPQFMFSQPQLVHLAHLRDLAAGQLEQLETSRSSAVGADALGRSQARGEPPPAEMGAQIAKLQSSGTPQGANQARGMQLQQVIAQSQQLEEQGAKAIAKGDIAGGHKLFDQARALMDQGLSIPGLVPTERTALMERKANLHISEAGVLGKAAETKASKPEDAKKPEAATKPEAKPEEKKAEGKADDKKAEGKKEEKKPEETEEQKKLREEAEAKAKAADKQHVEDLKKAISECMAAGKKEYTLLAADLRNQPNLIELKQGAPISAEQRKSFLDYADQMDARAKGCDAETHSIQSELLNRAGDRKGQQAELLNAVGASMGLSDQDLGELFKPDDTRKIMPDGDEKQWFNPLDHVADWFGGAQEIGDIKKERIDDIATKIVGLPEESRGQALDALCRYTEAAGGNADGTGMNIGQELLQAIAGKSKDPMLKLQADAFTGQYQLQIGKSEDALKSFTEVRNAALKQQDPQLREILTTQGVMGMAQALSMQANGEEHDKKAAAAATLKALRIQMEQPGMPMKKDMLARLMMMEMDADLSSHRAKEAQAVLDHLRKDYAKEVPWLRESLEKWEKDNKDGDVAAFVQAALHEANSESMGESLGAFAIGSAVGAGIGVWAFGVGAAPGMLIGGAVAVVGVKARNIIRGWAGINEARETGLNNESFKQSMLDVTTLALDAITCIAPIKGAGAVMNGTLKGAGTVGLKGASKEGTELLSRALAKETAAAGEKAATQGAVKGAAGATEQIAADAAAKATAKTTTKAGLRDYFKLAADRPLYEQTVKTAGARKMAEDRVKQFAKQGGEKLTKEEIATRAERMVPDLLLQQNSKALMKAGNQAASREWWRWFNRSIIPSMGAGLVIPVGVPFLGIDGLAASDGKDKLKQMQEMQAIQDKYANDIASMDAAFGAPPADGAPVDPQAAQAELAKNMQARFPSSPPETQMVDPAAAQQFVADRQAMIDAQGLPAPVAAQAQARLASFGREGVAAFDPLTADVRVNPEAMGQPGSQEIVQRELARQKLHSLPPAQFQAVVGSVLQDPAFPALAQAFVKANPQAAQYSGPQLVDEILISALMAGSKEAFVQAPAVAEAGLSAPPQIPQ